MRLIFFVVLYFWPAAGIFAQTLHSSFPAGPPNPGVYHRKFIDAFSFTGNLAVLSFSKNLMEGICSGRKFMVAELGYAVNALSFPLASGGMGIQFIHYGFSDYNESKLGLSYGFMLGPRISMGVQFNYQQAQVAGYGHAQAINADLGMIIQLSDHLRGGFQWYNLVGSKLKGLIEERLVSVFKTGIGYEISSLVYFQFDLIKEEDKSFDADAALHFILAEKWFGGIGIRTNLFAPYGWAGWTWKKYRIGISVSHHPWLGFTPGFYIEFGSPSVKTGS